MTDKDTEADPKKPTYLWKTGILNRLKDKEIELKKSDPDGRICNTYNKSTYSPHNNNPKLLRYQSRWQ